MLIPKKIHFIWVGGPIPKKYLESIEHVAALAKKSGFEVNVWVDNEKNYLDTLYKSSDSIASNVNIRHIATIFEKMKKEKFFQEADRARDYEAMIAREMVGFSNFGAASDLLRYAILAIEGGTYFDTDSVFPPNMELKQDDIEGGIRVPISLVSNSVEYSLRQNKLFDREEFTNDMISCVAHHELIEECILKCIENYKKIAAEKYEDINDAEYLKTELGEKIKSVASNWLTKEDLKRYPILNKSNKYSLFRRLDMNVVKDRMSLTIDASGPGVIHDVFMPKIEKLAEEYGNKLKTATCMDEKKEILKEFFKKFSEFSCDHFSADPNFLGIKVISQSHQTWLAKKGKKLKSFDIESVRNKKP